MYSVINMLSITTYIVIMKYMPGEAREVSRLVKVIGFVRCPLFRGPLTISLYILI